MSKRRVLVVDDALEMASAVVEYLGATGSTPRRVDSGAAACERFKAAPADVVLTDLRMKGLDGLDVLAGRARARPRRSGRHHDRVRRRRQRGRGDAARRLPLRHQAVQARRGPRPARARARRARRARENEALRRTVREVHDRRNARRPQRRRSRGRPSSCERVAATSAPVLILGETGTGKELVARAIHAEGPRARTRPFVAVNCAALPEALLESELFGHVTRRVHRRDADAAAACSSRPTAARCCSTRSATCRSPCRRSCCACSRRARSGRSAATRREPSTCASSPRPTGTCRRASVPGQFRQDLFYRLNVVPIAIPPLRERREDIPLLLEHFLRKSRERFPRRRRPPSRRDALKVLIEYAWPGNVRQLENLVDRWVITGDTAEIAAAESAARWATGNRRSPPARGEMLPLHAVEQRYIAWVLEKVGGNKTRAAEILQIDPSTIWRREKQGKT